MNLLDLFVKIGVDDQASEGVETLSGKLKSGLKTAAKIGMAAVTAATGAVVALTKQAVESYGEYEQLVGGAELMFGDAYDFIAEKAENAYSTVQMSMNDYLQQVNGFATGLKTALGGDEKAAAELADRIITAEADVVAATGNTQEAVQNAFNGIMKSNYTMLDNLQLGITPTKEGFQEVIDKVNEWNAANGKATSYQIDNLADAQKALVDYIEMQGLAGYAANEAAGTIQGSVASMKSAWQNLVLAFADDQADFDARMNAFVDSAVNAGHNLIPRIESTIQGIGKFISSASEKIVPTVVQTISDNLPLILTAGVDMVFALIDGIMNSLDGLISCAFSIISTVADKIAENTPELVAGGVAMITALISGIVENLPLLLKAALQIVMGLAQGLLSALPTLIAALPEIITGLVTGLLQFVPQIIQAGITLLTSLVGALPEIITAIVEALPHIIDGVVSALMESIPQIIQAGIDLFVALIQALPEIITTIIAAIPQIIGGIIDAVVGNIDKIILAGVQLFVALIENLPTIIVEIVKAVPKIITGIVEAFDGLMSQIVDVGANLLKGIWNGISDTVGWLKDKVSGVVNKIKSWFTGKDGFDEHSPSKWSNNVFRRVMEGAANGLDSGLPALMRKVDGVTGQVKDAMAFDIADMGVNVSGYGMSGFQPAYAGAVAQQPITIPITLELDGTTLARRTYLYNQAETDRRGKSFVR